MQIDPVDGRLPIEAVSGRWSYEKEARRDRETFGSISSMLFCC
jgi:hypothetical protein